MAETDRPDFCVVSAGAEDPRVLVLYLAMVDAPFEVLEPPEVVEAARSLAARLAAAAG